MTCFRVELQCMYGPTFFPKTALELNFFIKLLYSTLKSQFSTFCLLISSNFDLLLHSSGWLTQ